MADPDRDAIGRKRSPATYPEFRKGVTPANKGRDMSPEILTRREIADLLAVPAKTAALFARDRAIAWLMYRLDFKMAQVVRLERRHYQPDTGRLTVPGIQGGPDKTIPLDGRSREFLDAWIEHRRQMDLRPMTRMFCQVLGAARGNDIGDDSWRGTLRRNAKKAGIEKRLSPEGLRASGRAHGLAEVQRVEGQIEAYVDDHEFRSRFPSAYEKWHAAYDLFLLNPQLHASRIGHDCREALIEFASQLARDREVETDLPPGNTVDRIRAALDLRRAGISEKVGAFLDALLAYWGTVSDLAQRQEHAAGREKESLGYDDARRIVFQTMLVMYEIDNALRG
jgi:hypothetical protein